MLRSWHRKGWLLVALVLLFPIGASASIACCAGAIDQHAISNGKPSHCAESGSCCDRAAGDAVARHCCQGGDAIERPHSAPAPVLAATPAVVAAALPSIATPGELPPSARDPVPRTEPLYTLHSSLLI